LQLECFRRREDAKAELDRITGCVVSRAVAYSVPGPSWQANEQLKNQFSTLQKENSDLKGRVDELTTTRDALTKDNDALKTENKALKVKKPSWSTSKSLKK
jgi:FtsZ-binding cell division protein ZapB